MCAVLEGDIMKYLVLSEQLPNPKNISSTNMKYQDKKQMLTFYEPAGMKCLSLCFEDELIIKLDCL